MVGGGSSNGMSVLPPAWKMQLSEWSSEYSANNSDAMKTFFASDKNEQALLNDCYEALEGLEMCDAQRAKEYFLRAMLCCKATPTQRAFDNMEKEVGALLSEWISTHEYNANVLTSLRNCFWLAKRFSEKLLQGETFAPDLDAKIALNQIYLKQTTDLLSEYERTPFFGADYRRQKIAVLTALKPVLENNEKDEAANANLRKVVAQNPDYGHSYISSHSRVAVLFEQAQMLYPQMMTAVSTAANANEVVFVGTVVVEPEQQLKSDLQSELTKLRNEPLGFLGNTRQKIRVLKAALVFVNSKQKDVNGFAQALADNPAYASEIKSGKVTETVRLVREMVRLYPEVRSDLEARRQTLQTQRQVQEATRSGAGFFDRARSALVSSKEKEQLEALQSLSVPNSAPTTVVTGSVVKSVEYGRPAAVCAA